MTKNMTTRKKGLVSFSGGETSAYMAQWLIANMPEYEFVTVFANTGQELEETLEFVEKCDRLFGLNVVWVEADVQPYKQGTKAKTVDFDSASRSGEPFEAVIQKYGIPGVGFPHCSRELKLRPIKDYAKAIGWATGTYDTFIGIRADEIDRMNPSMGKEKILYPLVSQGFTKEDVNRFWDEQPFRLQIKGYEGNCKACWKKSKRKLLTIAKDHPERFDFVLKMEAQYGNVKPIGRDLDRYVLPVRFFREHTSAQQILDTATTNLFTPALDDRLRGLAFQQLAFDMSLDLGGGCSESCDAFSEEEEAIAGEVTAGEEGLRP